MNQQISTHYRLQELGNWARCVGMWECGVGIKSLDELKVRVFIFPGNQYR